MGTKEEPGQMVETSERLKETVRLAILNSCMSWTSQEQLQRIDQAISVALRDLTLSRQELALSTEVITPNEKYLKQFLAIKAVRGLSDKTRNYYEATIRYFFRYVQKPISKITVNDIRMYCAIREQNDKVSRVTINNELRNLRSFFNTLETEELIYPNPMKRIENLKVKKTVKKPFTEMEVEKIRKAAMNYECSSNKNMHFKASAIVEVLFSTACRVGEIATMRREDINDDRVKVLGKGNKERICYLNSRAIIALQDYFQAEKRISEYVFPGDENGHMGLSSIEGLVREIGKRAGVKECHPHRFRRTAATFALRHGMPIQQVSKMLGHENLDTTKIYAITDENEVHDAHKKYLA